MRCHRLGDWVEMIWNKWASTWTHCQNELLGNCHLSLLKARAACQTPSHYQLHELCTSSELWDDWTNKSKDSMKIATDVQRRVIHRNEHTSYPKDSYHAVDICKRHLDVCRWQIGILSVPGLGILNQISNRLVQLGHNSLWSQIVYLKLLALPYYTTCLLKCLQNDFWLSPYT